MWPKRLFILALWILSVWGVSPQSRVGVAWYDLGGLYDTEPSPFARDAEYLPEGSKRWTTERYMAAVDRYAVLIDSLAMPLVGLFGVENEQVALDLAARSRGDYSVEHRTSNRMDGLDFALLYQADRFLPERSDVGYGWMRVEGELDGQAVILLLVREDRFLAEEVERCRVQQPHHRLLVMGRIGRPEARFDLQDVLRPAEQRGYGTCFRRGGWQMRDRLWLDSRWQVLQSGVYIRRELLDEKTHRPLPLYQGEHYRGGWSGNLPVFLYLATEDLEN